MWIRWIRIRNTASQRYNIFMTKNVIVWRHDDEFGSGKEGTVK